MEPTVEPSTRPELGQHLMAAPMPSADAPTMNWSQVQWPWGAVSMLIVCAALIVLYVLV